MWQSADFSVDTIETYFDSHVDLLQRKLQKHSDRLKMKAEETFKIKDLNLKDLKLKDLKIKDLSGDLLAENLEREIKSFKLKVRIRCLRCFLRTQNAPTAAFNTRHLSTSIVAVRQGCANARKSVVFLRCYDVTFHRPHVWIGSSVRWLGRYL
jgi:hypothetical protein